MKKYVQLFILASLIIVATACGTTEEDRITEDQAQNDQTQTETPASNDNANDDTGAGNDDTTQDQSTSQNQAPNQDDMQNKMDELDYTEFELDVEYANNETYEAELKTKGQNQNLDAEIEDDLNGVNLKGEEAFNELFLLVEQLTIDQNTSKEDTIAEVLNVFNLPEDYQKFEIEITFRDGPTMEYEDKK